MEAHFLTRYWIFLFSEKTQKRRHIVNRGGFLVDFSKTTDNTEGICKSSGISLTLLAIQAKTRYKQDELAVQLQKIWSRI